MQALNATGVGVLLTTGVEHPVVLNAIAAASAKPHSPLKPLKLEDITVPCCLECVNQALHALGVFFGGDQKRIRGINHDDVF